MRPHYFIHHQESLRHLSIAHRRARKRVIECAKRGNLQRVSLRTQSLLKTGWLIYQLHTLDIFRWPEAERRMCSRKRAGSHHTSGGEKLCMRGIRSSPRRIPGPFGTAHAVAIPSRTKFSGGSSIQRRIESNFVRKTFVSANEKLTTCGYRLKYCTGDLAPIPDLHPCPVPSASREKHIDKQCLSLWRWLMPDTEFRSLAPDRLLLTLKRSSEPAPDIVRTNPLGTSEIPNRDMMCPGLEDIMTDKIKSLEQLIEVMRQDRKTRDLIRCGFYSAPVRVAAFNPWRFAAVFERLTNGKLSFEPWLEKYGFI